MIIEIYDTDINCHLRIQLIKETDNVSITVVENKEFNRSSEDCHDMSVEELCNLLESNTLLTDSQPMAQLLNELIKICNRGMKKDIIDAIRNRDVEKLKKCLNRDINLQDAEAVNKAMMKSNQVSKPNTHRFIEIKDETDCDKDPDKNGDPIEIFKKYYIYKEKS